MSKEMLINMVEGQECRIAILKDGVLDELYVERESTASRVGNIYKGRVTNVEASIQAAFVDFGQPKNGFLHITDIHPHYFPKSLQGSETVGHKRPHRERPPIQACLRRGQEVVVQVTKDGIGTKGPTLTTYLSIPGRLLVMLPGMSRIGVSRKVEDEDLRAKARSILAELTLPPDMGFICRTAGMERSKRDLQRDLNYLTRLWNSVRQRIKSSRAPAEIYQESDLVIRTLRDVYNTDVNRILCDSEPVARKVNDFLRVAMPRTKNVIELYTGKGGLFHDYGLEEEIEKIFARRVELPSGGSLVIDQTEALVAIDVNSGRYREHTDAETTALKTNLEAAGEIARQLRLRDMGGVIVMDFIDMREQRNRRAVEKALRDAVKTDRAKSKILRISNFGIIEMTRQRLRPSLKSGVFSVCSHCDGAGVIKSVESLALFVIRSIQRACGNDEVAEVEVAVHPQVANQLTNYHRRQLCKLEADTERRILIRAETNLGADDVQMTCRNSRGSDVAMKSPESDKGRPQKAETIPFDRLPSRGRTGKGDKTFVDEADDLMGDEETGAPSQPAPQDSVATKTAAQAGAAPVQPAQSGQGGGTGQPAAPGQKSGRRSRRRGRRKPHGQAETAGKQAETPVADTVCKQTVPPGDAVKQAVSPGETPPAAPVKKKSRRHRGGRKHRKKGHDASSVPAPAGNSAAGTPAGGAPPAQAGQPQGEPNPPTTQG